jgi:glutathione S-transferase
MKLYYAPLSRSFRALWMLEELGVPYERERVDIRAGAHKQPAYLAINPSGKVPALVDRGIAIPESAAICAWLADRFPERGLAPPLGAPERGAYLRWMFYAVGVMEPSFTDRVLERESPNFNVAWGDWESVAGVVSDAVAPGPWLLGAPFTAADVMVGSIVHWGVEGTKLLAGRPALEAYTARLAARPAFQRAAAIDAAT